MDRDHPETITLLTANEIDFVYLPEPRTAGPKGGQFGADVDAADHQ
jgi:hypothetical protein